MAPRYDAAFTMRPGVMDGVAAEMVDGLIDADVVHQHVLREGAVGSGVPRKVVGPPMARFSRRKNGALKTHLRARRAGWPA